MHQQTNHLKLFCYLCLLQLIFLQVSCRKVVQKEYDEFEAQLTINSWLIADSLVNVHISQACNLDENPISIIETANITLTSNAGSQTLIHKGLGIYSSDIKIESNTSYLCTVGVDDKTIIAECNIPAKPLILSTDIHPGGWINNEGIPMPLFELELQNSTTDTLYFEVYIYSFSASLWGSYRPYGLEGKQSALKFTNEGHEDISFTQQIEFSRNSWSTSNTYAYILEVRALNKDAYNYLLSYDIYELGRYPDFGVSSPVSYNIYSNIVDGSGIFAGYAATATDTLFEIQPSYHD